MKYLNATLTFRKIYHSVSEIEICYFSDAAFNILRNSDYAHPGVIFASIIRKKYGLESFHVLGWASSKQWQVSHSTCGA